MYFLYLFIYSQLLRILSYTPKVKAISSLQKKCMYTWVIAPSGVVTAWDKHTLTQFCTRTNPQNSLLSISGLQEGGGRGGKG